MVMIISYSTLTSVSSSHFQHLYLYHLHNLNDDNILLDVCYEIAVTEKFQS